MSTRANDHFINASTFKFLKELKKNNNREWFTDHKHEYEAAKANVVLLVEDVLKHLVKTIPAFKEVNAAKTIARIYRDVRFSKNKDPYKLNFGIMLFPKGRGVNAPGYYLHIQPGECFVGGGFWMPPAEELRMIRQEIDYNAEEFKKIISSKTFTKFFDGLSEEDKLKTAPKGYPKDHPELELLKLKSFTAFHAIPDAEFQENAVSKKIADAVIALQPLIVFLEAAVEQ